MRLITIAVVLLACASVGCVSNRTSQKKERVEANVVAVDPKAQVLHIEDFGGVGCGQIEEAFLATVRVVSPARYAGREFQIRLTTRESTAVPAAAAVFTRTGARLLLELSSRILELAPNQIVDFSVGEVTVTKEPNKLPEPTATTGRGSS